MEGVRTVGSVSPGQELAGLRRSLELTQKECARALGVSRAALNHWEQDRAPPARAVMLRMRRAAAWYLPRRARSLELLAPGKP
jgi:DNA-binding transcriptional regulator YiaG